MIMNSLIHGFENIVQGTININIQQVDDSLLIQYSDDGKGIDSDTLDQHFDAFFTTKRGKGGSGLGTHIMYNLVTQALNGTIKASSPDDKGLSYNISIPL